MLQAFGEFQSFEKVVFDHFCEFSNAFMENKFLKVFISSFSLMLL
jgi:hypothetical protein